MTCQPHDPRTKAYRHASERLLERYGLPLTLTEYLTLCDVAGDQGQRLAQADLGREVLSLRVHGTPTRCVYCPRTSTLITFLHPYYHASPPAQWHAQARHPRIEGMRQPVHPPYKRPNKGERDDT